MIISLPQHRLGDTVPSQLETPVSLIDLYPTLCALAGADFSETEGRDLSDSLLQGVEPETIPIFSDSLRPRWGEGSEYRMIRYGDFKYVGFRDGSEFMFNLVDDPLEQSDLSKRSLDTETQSVLEKLRGICAETMDFDAAEKERIEGTRDLEARFPHRIGPTQNNLYHFKDGRIINGEDVVYNPTVVAKSAEEAFGADWQEQNMPQ